MDEDWKYTKIYVKQNICYHQYKEPKMKKKRKKENLLTS